MNYAKPEIHILGNASRVIQGQPKTVDPFLDSNPPDTMVIYHTNGAYESDE
jgi:hypothetical protein